MSHSPNALIECAQLGYQLRGPFVLITTQVVDSFYSLRRGLQLVFANANPLVLKPHKLVSEDGSVAPSLSRVKSQSTVQLHSHTAHEARNHRLLLGRLRGVRFIPLVSPSVKGATQFLQAPSSFGISCTVVKTLPVLGSQP